jgi:hypothetical protein
MRSIIVIIAMLIASCQRTSNTDTKQFSATTELIVGADRDEKGCIGSGGYTWSVVKNSCIRVFETGSPFEKYDVATGATDSLTVAFVVLSDDKQRAEAFFGTSDKPIVMEALPVMEGETMPILFENKTEMLKIRSYRDIYQLVFLDTVRYVQYYDAEKSMGKWMVR